MAWVHPLHRSLGPLQALVERRFFPPLTLLLSTSPANCPQHVPAASSLQRPMSSSALSSPFVKLLSLGSDEPVSYLETFSLPVMAPLIPQMWGCGFSCFIFLSLFTLSQSKPICSYTSTACPGSLVPNPLPLPASSKPTMQALNMPDF